IVHDEIEKYFSCRYISACEATWRLLAFPTHHRTTSVVKLSFHLPDRQFCVYNPDDPIEDVLNRRSVSHSMFLAWMEANKLFPELTKDLTYADFPTAFVWRAKERVWKIRERGFAIGRITHVPRSAGEDYYLRILLNKVPGPKSFDEIKTVNGIVYDTFHDACFAKGLLDDDREYIDAITEASLWGSGNYLRKLFVVMLMSNSVDDPLRVWNATWEMLSEDLLHKERVDRGDPGLTLTEDQIKYLGLVAIEQILRNSSSSLANFAGMMCPDMGLNNGVLNSLVDDELRYTESEQRDIYLDHYVKLTDEQKKVTTDPALAQEIESFSRWLLDVGDGKINEPNSGEVDIDIPDDLLVTDVQNPIESIVKTVYGANYGVIQTASFLRERAILCPTNKDVDVINNFMLDHLQGYEKSYLSSDSIEPA
ncbi:unnamed protein product, partial [Arabidopsis halleri]